MTDEQLEAMRAEARKAVTVACTDSALKGCLHGDPMAVAVCVLCEELEDLRSRLRSVCRDAGIALTF